jgi:hypothetical protein
MSTQINVTVGSGGLSDKARQLQTAARQAQLEKERQQRIEKEGQEQRTASLAAAGKAPDGSPLFGPDFRQPEVDRRPAATRSGETPQGWGSFWTIGRNNILALRHTYNYFTEVSSVAASLRSNGKVYVASGDRTSYALLNDNESVLNNGPVTGGFYRVFPIKGDRAIVVFRKTFGATTTDGMVVVSHTGARRLPYDTIPEYFRQRIIGNVPTNYGHWQGIGWAYASSGTNNLNIGGNLVGAWNPGSANNVVVPWSVFWPASPTNYTASISTNGTVPGSSSPLNIFGPSGHKLIEWGITTLNQTDPSAYPSTAIYSPYMPEYWDMDKQPLRLDSNTAWGSPQSFKVKTLSGIPVMLETAHVYYDVENTITENPYGIQVLNDSSWKSLYATFLQEANTMPLGGSFQIDPVILNNPKWKSRSVRSKSFGSRVPTADYPEGQSGTPAASVAAPSAGNPYSSVTGQSISITSDGDFIHGTYSITYVYSDASTRSAITPFALSNTNIQQHVFCDWGEDWSDRFLQYGLTEADLTP